MVSKLIAVLFLIAGLAGNVALAGWPSSGSKYSASTPITSVGIGAAFQYNSNFPTKYLNADTFYSTWADDNKIYVTSNDSYGWNGWINAGNPAGGSNIQISTVSAFDNTITGTLVNSMAAWGSHAQGGGDGATYKSGGIISVGGVLYVSVYRQFGACSTGQAYGTQIIKSSDHGATWSPSPPGTALPYASPMFTNKNDVFSFVQYTNKDYSGQTADNSNTYVYAIISNFYNSFNPSNRSTPNYLGRVKIANIGNLSASDWSFYTGGDGMIDANWSGTFSNAVAVVTANNAETAVQYFPTLHRYFMIGTYEPDSTCSYSIPSNTIAQMYEAPHPWGPWTAVTTTSVNAFFPHGHYFLQPVMESVSGNNVTVFASGDFTQDHDPDVTSFYTLWEIPLTMNGGVSPTPPTGSCSQSTAFFARAYGYGFTLDSTHRTAYDNLICGLVTDGVWSLLDGLYIFATQNAPLAQMNLTQSAFSTQSHALVSGPPTNSNAPVFTTDRGFTGQDLNNLSYYLDTQFTPSLVSSPAYALNSAHISTWTVTNTAASATAGGATMGAKDANAESDIFPAYDGDGNTYGRINDNPASGAQGIPATQKGHWIVDRTATSTSTIYHNGASFSSPNESSTNVPAEDFYVLTAEWPAFCNAASCPHGSTAQQIAMASVGAGMTGTQAGNFYTRLRTYMTAVGVP